MTAGIHQLGVARLLDAFRAGRVSAVAATDHYLERIRRFASLNAFTALDQRARDAAADSARRYDSGAMRALEGVPVAIKANLDIAGLATTGGIGARRNAVAREDSAVVARLRAAGAVILGHTNTHEAALGATTDNESYGRTFNPHGPSPGRQGLTPGGSSGGSGAAVAAGLCAAALGTDTLGSVRIPAAYCGVFGLKPTAGLVPDAGLLHLVRRWDCIGPLARSVEDLGLVLAALADVAPARPLARIALPEDLPEPADPAIAAALRLSADLLRGIGCAVDGAALGIDIHRVRLAGFVEAAREADARFGSAIDADPDGFSAPFKSYLAFGRRFDAAALAQGEAQLADAARRFDAPLLAADALLLPATPQAAFPHAAEAPSSQADYTALANIAGLPAIALPAGWTADGLPVAVQLVGRAGEDASLVALAARLDAALNAYRPPTGYE